MIVVQAAAELVYVLYNRVSQEKAQLQAKPNDKIDMTKTAD